MCVFVVAVLVFIVVVDIFMVADDFIIPIINHTEKRARARACVCECENEEEEADEEVEEEEEEGRDRQRQTHRHTYTQTDTQTHRHTERHTDRHTDRDRERRRQQMTDTVDKRKAVRPIARQALLHREAIEHSRDEERLKIAWFNALPRRTGGGSATRGEVLYVNRHPRHGTKATHC